MKIQLEEFPAGEQRVIEAGPFHITAYLRNGKACLTISTLKNQDFIQVQPSTGNSIIVISSKDIRI